MGGHIAGKANRRVSGSHSGSHSVFPYCLAAAVDGARAFLERSKRAFPERKDDLGFMPTHSSSQDVGGDFGEWLSFRGACVIGLPPWNNVSSVLASPFPHSSQRPHICFMQTFSSEAVFGNDYRPLDSLI